jgi:hypothetical protein
MNLASANNTPLVAVTTPLSGQPTSAVSWGAIFAGAAGAAALSLILLMLGTGLGLSSVSPWVNAGISAQSLGVSTIVWITFTQLAAAALGGYLAGRLRTKWLSVPIDEVHFRDTAHGFLAWAAATLFTAALLTSTIAALLGSTADGAIAALNAPHSGPAKRGAEQLDRNGMRYRLDKLFRAPTVNAIDPMVSEPISQDFSDEGAARSSRAPARNQRYAHAEVKRIFANARMRGVEGNKTLPDDDLSYVASLVEQQTGLSQVDAQKRVRDSYSLAQTQAAEFKSLAKLAADKARKAAAKTSLWLFISLLIGAFVASLAATLGAKHRDD